MKTGFNDAFYLDDADMQSIILAEPQSRELIKPFIRGRDIKRWNVAWDRQWHIVIPSSQNRRWPWSLVQNEAAAEMEFSRLHPGLYSHLKQYEEGLRGRTDQGRFWWELRACDYYEKFEQSKIAISRASFHGACGLDSVGYFQNDSTVFVPTNDLFVLAVLNSRLGWWYMTLTFPHLKDEAIYMHADHLARLPIPRTTESLKESIRGLCQNILSLIGDPTGELTAVIDLERELSDLVFKAYDFSSREQQILDDIAVLRDPLAVLRARIAGH